jgi:hypothetical protein
MKYKGKTNMTPKEKAEQLIDKMYSISGLIRFSKIYAIVAVNEVIEQWEYIDTYLADGRGQLNPNLKYWYEVKKCIEAF